MSPNQEHVVDDGWVWHPVGIVRTWNFCSWIRENVWESEDGASKKDLCIRDYFWDGPMCWIDDQRLAVWGFGEDQEWLIPAVRIFNVVSGKEEGWFPGPRGSMIFDEYLFSFEAETGTSVWDVNTGERLLHDQPFITYRYHPGAKCFLTWLPDGHVRISRLKGLRLDPACLAWNDRTVVRIAEAISAENDFEKLPILADALEEAGCQDTHVLHHCRQPGEHGKRCWVIDRILEGQAD